MIPGIWILDWLALEAKIEHLFDVHAPANPDPYSPAFSAHGFPHRASLHLLRRRIRSVRHACDLAEREAAHQLLKRFADLDIHDILDDLIEVVAEMAMIVVGSTVTGAVIGGGIGFFAAGIGAVPGAASGALIGAQAGGWLLNILGLASVAEFFMDGLPAIIEGYVRGIATAWRGPRELPNDPLNTFYDDPTAAQQGAWDIARSHEAVVVLLLGAIVAYLTRGGGSARVLAQDMQRSARGSRIAQWMLKHEDKLKRHPDLKTPEPRRVEAGQGNASPLSPKPDDRHEGPGKGKSTTMPVHEVECFRADRLPASKGDEFVRQLKGQEGGLNRLTVEEYLENIANPQKRNKTIAALARAKLSNQIRRRLEEAYSATMSPTKAKALAKKHAKETMSTLAALHNPDLSAGGKDIIADFGDRQVNSSIGPQWKSKINGIKAAAERIPLPARKHTLLNVKLYKC
ncbi:DUF6861 domain-containing protein [Enterobacterales bacterium AW_CKDN230030176-1A_HGKHYDSX7]